MKNQSISNQIKLELKKLGYSNRLVSVRNERGGYERSVTVQIKSPKVNESEVRSLIKKFDRVDRCESTGDILSGGNTFVFVNRYRP